MYQCKIIADSVYESNRLTTFEVTYPLIIHAEMLRHRMLSRNVASARAIPIAKMIQAVQENPFIPAKWPKNKAGMQNEEWLESPDIEREWLDARDNAIKSAERLSDLGVHKQITNRLLYPFMWCTEVITGTDWENFFSLRCHPDAQLEIRTIAEMMRKKLYRARPEELTEVDWHLPYDEPELPLCDRIKVSIGRCARVSYLTHGTSNTPEKDITLCNRLIESRHFSPTEHVAKPGQDKYYANFKGWIQFRQTIPHENGQEKA